MEKKSFVVDISKVLDEKFRKVVKEQGKMFNLALEEALKLWLEKNEKNKDI